MANRFTISTVFTADDKLTGPMRKMGQEVETFGKRARNVAIGVVAIGAATFAVGKQFVDAAAEVQKYKTALTVMLGSQEAANARFEEMQKFAATTPFELTDVVQLGNQLQALGKYSVENMTMLGDLASAAGKPIEQVTGAFAKLASGQKGIAVDMFRDLLITTDDWVKATGKGVSASGSLLATTEEMMAVLPKILAEKGFDGMMKEQSKTFNGRVSNMMDSVFQFKAAVGEAMIEPVGDIVEKIGLLLGKLTAWASANKEIINTRIGQFINGLSAALDVVITVVSFLFKVLKPLAPFIIGITAAVVAYNAAMAICEAVTVAATVAQMVLNGAMTANPIGLVVVAIGVLIGIVILLVKHWDDVVIVLKKAWEIIKGVGQAFLKYLLMPINLVMDAIGGLLKLVSKIPGVGDALKPAIAALDSVQAKMNSTLTGVAGAYDFAGVAENTAGNVAAVGKTPVSSQTTVNKTTTSKVDVNFANAPAGTTMKQTGAAPGVTLNMGYAGVRGL